MREASTTTIYHPPPIDRGKFDSRGQCPSEHSIASDTDKSKSIARADVVFAEHTAAAAAAGAPFGL